MLRSPPHYPILLLASGGIAELERANWTEGFLSCYNGRDNPSIALDPAEITREGTADVWVYRAKDTAANADLAVQLMREPCTDPASQAKYTFHAVVHAFIDWKAGRVRPHRRRTFSQDAGPNGAGGR